MMGTNFRHTHFFIITLSLLICLHQEANGSFCPSTGASNHQTCICKGGSAYNVDSYPGGDAICERGKVCVKGTNAPSANTNGTNGNCTDPAPCTETWYTPYSGCTLQYA